MKQSSPNNLSVEDKLGFIIDAMLDAYQSTIIEPMLINLSRARSGYYVSDLNLASVYDEDFGEFLFEYTKETASNIDSEVTIVLFPGVFDDEKKSMQVVDFIDFKQETPRSPLIVAVIDDGTEIRSFLFQVSGIPKKSLMSIPKPDLNVTTDFLAALIEHWGVDEEIKPGMFFKKRPKEEPAYDPDTDLTWAPIDDLMPTAH